MMRILSRQFDTAKQTHFIDLFSTYRHLVEGPNLEKSVTRASRKKNESPATTPSKNKKAFGEEIRFKEIGQTLSPENIKYLLSILFKCIQDNAASPKLELKKQKTLAPNALITPIK